MRDLEIPSLTARGGPKFDKGSWIPLLGTPPASTNVPNYRNLHPGIENSSNLTSKLVADHPKIETRSIDPRDDFVLPVGS